jgi:hypothetical protein
VIAAATLAADGQRNVLSQIPASPAILAPGLTLQPITLDESLGELGDFGSSGGAISSLLFSAAVEGVSVDGANYNLGSSVGSEPGASQGASSQPVSSTSESGSSSSGEDSDEESAI